MYHVTHLTESCMRDYSRLIFIETTGTRCRPKHSSLIPQKSLIWYLRIFRLLGVCELCTADGAGLRWATDETSVTVEKKSDNLGMDAPRFLWAAAWIPHGPLQGDPWAASVSSPLSIPSDDMFCWQHRLPLRCHFANSKKPPSRSCWETRSHTRLFSQWFQVNSVPVKAPFETSFCHWQVIWAAWGCSVQIVLSNVKDGAERLHFKCASVKHICLLYDGRREHIR